MLRRFSKPCTVKPTYRGKMKILILNNYDLEYTFKEWQQDGQSAHQAWGITQMEQYGIKASILPYKRFDFLKKLSERIKVLGDLDQEIRVLATSRNYDLIYSGHYITTSLLAFSRKLGILRKPIVAIAFQAPRKSIWATFYVKLFVSGNDKLICLSEGIRQHFESEFGISPKRLEFIEWGYDTAFHQSKPMNFSEIHKNGYILSTGKSFRDYKTLVEAFSTLNYPLNIIGYSDNILDGLARIPKNVEMTIPLKAISGGASTHSPNLSDLPSNIKTSERLLKTSEVLAKFNNAFAVAIPLDLPPNKPHNTVGLSSLLEAMCMGRAVITTENKDMGVDLEKEGIGLTVPHKDVLAWRQAAQYLLDHPEETQEMGQRARYLAEKRYNLEHFTQKTVQCMQGLI